MWGHREGRREGERGRKREGGEGEGEEGGYALLLFSLQYFSLYFFIIAYSLYSAPAPLLLVLSQPSLSWTESLF